MSRNDSGNDTGGGTRPPPDAKINKQASSAQSVKRADLLNNQPRTKSLGKQGPAFTSTDDKNSFPCPSDPYD